MIATAVFFLSSKLYEDLDFYSSRKIIRIQGALWVYHTIIQCGTVDLPKALVSHPLAPRTPHSLPNWLRRISAEGGAGGLTSGACATPGIHVFEWVVQ